MGTVALVRTPFPAEESKIIKIFLKVLVYFKCKDKSGNNCIKSTAIDGVVRAALWGRHILICQSQLTEAALAHTHISGR